MNGGHLLQGATGAVQQFGLKPLDDPRGSNACRCLDGGSRFALEGTDSSRQPVRDGCGCHADLLSEPGTAFTENPEGFCQVVMKLHA